MDDPPAVTARKPCCVCAEPGGQHCTKCKSRHYCGKACQLVDWKGGHKAACKQLAAEFQDQLFDELMPEMMKIKKEPVIVEDIAPADGSKTAARLPAVQTTAAKAGALSDDAPSWRDTCAICLDLLPIEMEKRMFYECCCEKICTVCSGKCRQYDKRCPLCRAPSSKSYAEWLRRVQKHVDTGVAEAQSQLGDKYRAGAMDLKKSPKRAFELFALAAAQGHAIAQNSLGLCYNDGEGVKINFKTAAQWYRRAADQRFPLAQYNLGSMFYKGKGVAQSFDEAVRWYRLAAAQGDADALYNLGLCYASGCSVAHNFDEALRHCKAAAAKGHTGAAAAAEQLRAVLAATHGR